MQANLLSTDRAWFRKHAETNFRIRRPAAGEIAEIARRMTPTVEYELPLTEGEMPNPSPHHEWRVLVIDMGNWALARMLVLHDLNAAGDAAVQTGPWSGFAVALGHRLLIDQDDHR